MHDPVWAPIYRVLSRYHPIPIAEWDALGSQLKPRLIRKGRHLLRPGAVAVGLAFVASGLFRKYRVHGTAEANIGFLGPGSCASDYASLMLGVPSECGIAAVADSRIGMLSRQSLDALVAQHPCWRAMLLNAGAWLQRGRDQRIAELLATPTEYRYRALLLRCPEVERLAPQREIASYLGVTPETLSRLRRRLRSAEVPHRAGPSDIPPA
jgi:CRP-like cAMP-binding protein